MRAVLIAIVLLALPAQAQAPCARDDHECRIDAILDLIDNQLAREEALEGRIFQLEGEVDDLRNELIAVQDDLLFR